MYAVVLAEPGSMALVNRPEPEAPAHGQVLVAVRRVGICGTDHHAFGGTQNFIEYPRVLGHELAVEVVAVGAGVEDLEPGDQCAVLPYLWCGACSPCRRGRSNCCERISVLGVTVDGGLREHMVVPATQLFHSDNLDLDQLVLIETLGIGWHAVARARPRTSDSVLVLGAGPIGLAVTLAADHAGAHVVVADLATERVEFADRAGIDAVVVEPGFVDIVRDRCGGHLPGVVFDASGSRTSMESAFNLVGPAGTVVLVGHTTGAITFANPTFHARELDVLGSRNATVQDWKGVITAVESGALDARNWINHRSTLADIVDDLPRLASEAGSVMKTVVTVGGH